MRCLGGRNAVGIGGMPGVDSEQWGAVPLDQREADGREGARMESEGWGNPGVGWCGRGGGDEG